MLIMRSAVALLGFALAPSFAQTVAGPVQDRRQMSHLTVHQDKLPKGCRLAIEKEMPGLYKENPWIGSSGPRLANLRSIVEGPPPGTEPLRRDATTMRSAEHVLEAYAARYVAENDGWVQVSAVRFDDPKWTSAAALIRIEGETMRIILGTIAVHVARSTPLKWAQPGDLTQACHDAVRTYISALKP